MYYWTPKRIKELKDAGYKLHSSPASLVKKSDQAISEDASTEATSVRPDPGLKQRDSQVVNQVKLSSQSQASGSKLQATSSKHQASSAKLREK